MNKILTFILTLLVSFAPAFCTESNLDEMIGQMIIVGFTGDEETSNGFKDVLKQAEDGKISGVIFFEDNIKDKESLSKMTKALYEARMKEHPFISIDMEGGIIQRMNAKNGFKDFPAAEEISKKSQREAYGTYFKMAQMIKETGFDLNFAPCVDLDLNKNSIIHQKKRSYSSDPRKVTSYARQFINAHYDKGIATSIKHFPGHGSVSDDTHLNMADATKTFKEIELAPYKNLVDLNNLQTVMVSHIYNKNFDEIYPASLSNSTVTGILRNKFDFDGVIITDDLNMGAIKENYSLEETIIQAINAGCDILLFSNRENHNPNLADEINAIIKKAILDGQIQPDRIKKSYKRIVKLKQNLAKAQKR